MLGFWRPLLLILCALSLRAESVEPLSLTRVSDVVWVAVGETAAPSYQNAGHNNNLSIILGDAEVMVVNGGDNAWLAERLHAAIRRLTDKPVTWVINENGQGHAFLGNSYWRDQGARLFAHQDALADIQSRGEFVLDAMRKRNKEKASGTAIALPEAIAEDRWIVPIGGVEVQVLRFGPAHSPGDVSVWLPGEGILIAGDIAFHERIPGVFPETDVQEWLASYDRMRRLPIRLIVPGHGHPTIENDTKETTYNYLKYLWEASMAILDEGGGLSEAYEIDQSAFAHLDTFDELAVKNAGRVFQQVEMIFFE